MMSQSLSTHEVELQKQNANGGGGGAHASPLEIDALAGPENYAMESVTFDDDHEQAKAEKAARTGPNGEVKHARSKMAAKRPWWQEDWYRPEFKGSDAQDYLESAPSGAFIVRKPTKPPKGETLAQKSVVLSVQSGEKVCNVLVRNTLDPADGKAWYVWDAKNWFEDMMDLVMIAHKHPFYFPKLKTAAVLLNLTSAKVAEITHKKKGGVAKTKATTLEATDQIAAEEPLYRPIYDAVGGDDDDGGQVGYQMAAATGPAAPVEPESAYSAAPLAQEDAAYHLAAATGIDAVDAGDDDDDDDGSQAYHLAAATGLELEMNEVVTEDGEAYYAMATATVPLDADAGDAPEEEAAYHLAAASDEGGGDGEGEGDGGGDQAYHIAAATSVEPKTASNEGGGMYHMAAASGP